jgi:hypothetical protein
MITGRAFALLWRVRALFVRIGLYVYVLGCLYPAGRDAFLKPDLTIVSYSQRCLG